MGTVKQAYGPWSGQMLTALRERGFLKQEALAAWLAERDMQVDRTLISHWVADRSHLPADLLPHLAAFTERPDLVYGLFLRESGCDVVRLPEAAKSDRDLTDLMLQTGASLGRLHSRVLQARAPESPGGENITREERKALVRDLDELIQRLADLKAQL